MRYYLDTEFNGFGGDLISLALVRDDGAFIYLADHVAEPDQWVAINVIPKIDVGEAPKWVSRATFGHHIRDFLSGDEKPVIVADWPDDIRYFCVSLIVGPGQRVRPLPDIVFVIKWIDAYPTTLPGAVQHNALWDARAIRHKLIPV